DCLRMPLAYTWQSHLVVAPCAHTAAAPNRGEDRNSPEAGQHALLTLSYAAIPCPAQKATVAGWAFCADLHHRLRTSIKGQSNRGSKTARALKKDSSAAIRRCRDAEV